MISIHSRASAVCLASVLLMVGLAGCSSIATGGSTVSTLATDRRSTVTQKADDSIEQNAGARAAEVLAGKGHININSYFRKVLLTGEVPTDQDRQRVHAAVAGTPEVAGVVNELAVMPNSTLMQRSSDGLVTGKVKTNLMRANGVPNHSIKVVTERGATYLMGRLTEREAALATEVARTTSGVERVVRVIDFISEQSVLNPATPSAVKAPAAPVAEASPTPVAVPGVVTSPVTQPTIVNAPQPIQVQTLPPVKK